MTLAAASSGSYDWAACLFRRGARSLLLSLPMKDEADVDGGKRASEREREREPSTRHGAARIQTTKLTQPG